MHKRTLSIDQVAEGNNAVLYKASDGYVTYEKLSNTIHFGDRTEIERIYTLVEGVEYAPKFENGSLKEKEADDLSALVLNITEGCNLRCRYCIYSGDYVGERTNDGKQMSFETAKNAIDTFMERSSEDVLIGFYGGEPLNNMPLIKKTIAYIKEAYPHKKTAFSMTTNFYQSERYLDFFVQNDMHLNISIDGPKEIHDQNRIAKNGKPTYDKIKKSLTVLDERYPKFAKTHVGLSGTYCDGAGFESIIRDYIENNDRFTAMRLSSAEKKGSRLETVPGASMEAILRYAEKFLSTIINDEEPPKIFQTLFKSSLETICSKGTRRMPDTLPLHGSCYPGQRKLFVDTDGMFRPCEKFGDRAEIGLSEAGIDREKINGLIDRFTEIRDTLCSPCWAQRLCLPCIQSAKDPQGGLSTHGLEQTCASSKIQILLGIELYISLLQANPTVLERYATTGNLESGG